MILATLKGQTRALHERAEAAMPLFDPALNRSGYAGVLARLWPLYAALEARVERDLPAEHLRQLAWPLRRKTPWLEQDLRALGRAVPTVPLALTLPPGEAAAWGALYVMEGATLGGQLIRRHLARQLGLEADGLAFFGSYGALVGPRWQTFGAALNERHTQDPAPADFEARVVVGAWHGFEAFIRAVAAPAEVGA